MCIICESVKVHVSLYALHLSFFRVLPDVVFPSTFQYWFFFAISCDKDVIFVEFWSKFSIVETVLTI